MSRVGGKIRVGRVTPIQQFFFFGLKFKQLLQTIQQAHAHNFQPTRN